MTRSRALRRNRSLALLALAAALVPACATPAPSGAVAAPTDGDIVIDEVGAGTPDDPAASFFELRNLSPHAVDLSGWRVHRCTGDGTRLAEADHEVDLAGVVLEPGERITVGTGVDADVAMRGPFSSEGYGLVLEDARRRAVDAFAAYPSEPWPTQSECSAAGNVPDALGAALDESWQRVARTGDLAADFVRTRATPREAAAPAVEPAEPRALISEVASAGPGGRDDDLVELRAVADVDLSGWALYRCTRTGALTPETLQARFADGTELREGERLVVGGPGFRGDVDMRTTTSLADTVSGVLLVDADGARVDGVSVSNHADTACQTGDAKLPSVLDHLRGESWQRHEETGEFLIAPRTPGRENATADDRLETAFAYGDPGVALSEVATDPELPRAERHNLVELANYGDAVVDLSGWRIRACAPDGFRERTPLVEVPVGVRLAPGQTWLAALEGTRAAQRADAVYATALGYQGSGVWIEDAAGERVDSVGIFHRNEQDASNDVVSPCTKGLALSTFGVDRLAGETWQRVGFTGDDANDFRGGPASPGAPAPHDETPGGELTAEAALRTAAATPADGARAARAVAAAADEPQAVDGIDPVVARAFTGASEGRALTAEAAAGERPAALETARLAASDDGWAHPYVRFELARAADGTATWSGEVAGPAPARLSAWADGRWHAIDEEAAADDGTVTLSGTLPEGTTGLLVQVVPSGPAIADAADGLAAPGTYDFAVSHLTDTQYLSEAHPEVYREQTAWIAANAGPRDIAFAVHTGDLVQNWVDPDQGEERARREFAVASAAQGELDAAGVANSVLPGNHDNKRGATNDLFNEHFGPHRYADAPWYGGSIAPDDGSANWTSFTREGAEFIVLSLPYAYAERELAWAERVIAEHPRANIIVATHEHLLPEDASGSAERATENRWVSRADELWERIVAPHRSVVLVLSGHYHGLARIETDDAGGIPGHDVVEILGDYQEFRTETGMRATGFQRLLQVSLVTGEIAVDTISVTLGEHASAPFDYPQAVADDGRETTLAADRPWRIVEAGVQGRYDVADDDFRVSVGLQYPKGLATTGLRIAAP
ncbi:lamin tail domain-containing protein [Microbacterium barkeri]|uniref:metallophosphoesterase n=1 Tax=Microbacterium barkeri TaxID=33917 RepID=UPI0024AEA2FC|nr:lamin tail domain-containing protein [Microbacterium barkeri]MDI6941913.1 lamin tail domain-containing protein [Microbacterium barkeri]